MMTTRRSRALAWIGTIPHWLYFTALRANQPRLVPDRRLDVGARLRARGARTRARRHAVPAAASRSARDRDSVLRLDAVALHHRRRLRRVHADVGVQRPAVDGAVRVDERRRGSRCGATSSPADRSICRSSRRWTPATWNRVLDGRAIKEVEFARIQDEHYYVVRRAPDASRRRGTRERLHQPYNVTGRAEPDRLLVSAEHARGPARAVQRRFAGRQAHGRASRCADRRAAAAHGVRLVLLLARTADAAARAAREVRRSRARRGSTSIPR